MRGVRDQRAIEQYPRRYNLKWNELNAPLRHKVTIDDVVGSALHFLSDLSSGVNGEVYFFDPRYRVVAMIHEDSPDIALP